MTLLELLSLLRKNLKLVIALPVVFALAVAVYAFAAMPSVYTSEVSIYALTKTDSAITGANGASYSDLNASQMLANDFAELVENKQIQEKAAKLCGLEDLEDYKLEVVSSTTSRVIKVDVTGADAAKSARIANALAAVVSKTSKQVMNLDAVNIISKAEVADVPSGPNRKMYVAVAFLAGLFLAIALVVLKDMLNTSIRSDEEIEELLGLPVVGRFPYAEGGNK